jgi:hypothetical protein
MSFLFEDIFKHLFLFKDQAKSIALFEFKNNIEDELKYVC